MLKEVFRSHATRWREKENAHFNIFDGREYINFPPLPDLWPTRGITHSCTLKQAQLT
jgi:hypothetical protein